MKKLNIFLIALTMMIFSTAKAQFGVKLGPSFNIVASYGNTEDGESADMKLGFQGGLFYVTPISDKASLMVELAYEARGTVSKKDYTINFPLIDPTTGAPATNPQTGALVDPQAQYDISQEADSRHNYINLPILLLFGGEKFRYYIGPNIGFLMSAKADFTRSTTITSELFPPANTTLETDVEADWLDYSSFKETYSTAPPDNGNFLNSLELGINIGAMYSFTDNIFIDLRLNQGITDTTNNDYDNSIYPNANFGFDSREDTDRNLSIQLSLGYKF